MPALSCRWPWPGARRSVESFVAIWCEREVWKLWSNLLYMSEHVWFWSRRQHPTVCRVRLSGWCCCHFANVRRKEKKITCLVSSSASRPHDPRAPNSAFFFYPAIIVRHSLFFFKICCSYWFDPVCDIWVEEVLGNSILERSDLRRVKISRFFARVVSFSTGNLSLCCICSYLLVWWSVWCFSSKEAAKGCLKTIHNVFTEFLKINGSLADHIHEWEN